MSSNWKTTTWGELATIEYGKGLISYDNAIGEYPVYGTNGKIGSHTEPIFDKAGVIIGRKGAYRGVHYSKTPFFVIDTAFYLKPRIEFDLRWAYYQLLTQDINSMDSGSAIPSTSRPDFYALPVKLPPLPEQRAIAGMLGALDDKIEVNRRMNATLESMARSVFREMMKDEGGEDKTIGDVVTIVGGSTPSTTNPAFWNDGDIHWATPKDLAPLQSPILLDTNSRITELGLREISSGLLLVGTVLLSSRAPIGYLAISQIPVAINQGFIAIKCTEEVPNYFMLNWLKENMEAIEGRANGTTFLEISKSNFRPMPITIPSPEKMKVFVEQVEPLYQKIVANLKESRTLASLRDSLLPKLMRGKVRVKDIKR
jgi:type I restriction enzyme S subunit